MSKVSPVLSKGFAMISEDHEQSVSIEIPCAQSVQQNAKRPVAIMERVEVTGQFFVSNCRREWSLFGRRVGVMSCNR